MQTETSSAAFSLEKYRDQWGHLPLVFVPFLALIAAVLLLKALEPLLPEFVGTAVLSALGVGFAAFVLAFPRTWKRWKVRGGLELRVARGRVRLVDLLSLRDAGECPADAAHILPAEFHYTVTGRSMSGTFRAPAFLLVMDDGRRVSVGVAGSRFTWGGDRERVTRPDYAMSPGEWETFVELSGMSKRLVTVGDARVR